MAFKKGCIPWNKGKKGLYKQTIESNLKRSIALKGVKKSKKHCLNMSKAKKKQWNDPNSLFNSVKTKKKISNSLKGRPILEETKTKISNALKGRKLSKQRIKQMKEYAKSPKIVKQFKERMKYIIRPTKDTSIEVKIQNFLKKLGIEFFTHQYIKIEHGYQCDILIPSMNMVIETDGDYWHKYPIGNDLDHIRTKELLEKGFKVLRLWECEIIPMDLNKFKLRLYETQK